MATWEEERNSVRAAALADRMVLRALLGNVARLANPGDPREFVDKLLETTMGQLDVPGPVFSDVRSQLQSTGMTNLIRDELRDITSRLDWVDL